MHGGFRFVPSQDRNAVWDWSALVGEEHGGESGSLLFANLQLCSLARLQLTSSRLAIDRLGCPIARGDSQMGRWLLVCLDTSRRTEKGKEF